MISIERQIDREVKNVNTKPTDAQKEAGNYKKAHVTVNGFKITIENPKGSRRYYDGDKYNVMKNHYGYFNGSVGYDGDQVDVFIGDDLDSDKIFVVDQKKPSGGFDESKVMMGFKTEKEAKDAYMSNYEKNWKGFMAITEVSVEDFKKWLHARKKQRKAFSEYKKLYEMKEMGNYKQINLDNVTKPVFDYELFDNGNANYYFTTEEPLPNNAATLEEFFEYYVEETTQKIKWDFDLSYGGGQAFGTRDDGMEIQVDAGGNGDFMSHVITVTVQQNSQLNEKKMKNVIKLTESDIRKVIENSVKKVLKESYEDVPTNEPDFDEIVYYKAREIMRKYGYDSTEGFVRDKKVDVLEYVMDTYMDYYANDVKIREMDADEVAKLMAREAMKIIDQEYYEEEVAPLMEGKKVVKMNENQVRNIIRNCVKRVLKENYEPTQADWDDFGEWASSDEPDLWQDEMSAKQGKEQPDDGILIDADDEGEGFSKDYMAGQEYGKNLLAKSKNVDAIKAELTRLEDEGTISAYELGILDTIAENDV